MLPHRVLGAMGEDLDAALGHLARLDARDGEGRGAGAGLGVDRALHLDQRTGAKAFRREPSMRRAGIGDREGREMKAGILRDRCIELAAERRIGRLEQHLHIAAPEA